MKQNQEIVKAFASALGLKFTKTIFVRQLGIATSLLNTFSYEEIMSAINYLARYGYKKPISSLGFLPYIINEILAEIRILEMKKKEREAVVVAAEQPQATEELVIGNKKKMLENKFGSRGTIGF